MQRPQLLRTPLGAQGGDARCRRRARAAAPLPAGRDSGSRAVRAGGTDRQRISPGDAGDASCGARGDCDLCGLADYAGGARGDPAVHAADGCRSLRTDSPAVASQSDPALASHRLRRPRDTCRAAGIVSVPGGRPGQWDPAAGRASHRALRRQPRRLLCIEPLAAGVGFAARRRRRAGRSPQACVVAAAALDMVLRPTRPAGVLQPGAARGCASGLRPGIRVAGRRRSAGVRGPRRRRTRSGICDYPGSVDGL